METRTLVCRRCAAERPALERLRRQLETMVKSKVKAEIQALSSFGFQYLSQTYLPQKLKEADWI